MLQSLIHTRTAHSERRAAPSFVSTRVRPPWRRRVERVTGKIMLGARDCTERRADQMQKNPKIGWNSLQIRCSD
jgi:hypothetical protein